MSSYFMFNGINGVCNWIGGCLKGKLMGIMVE